MHTLKNGFFLIKEAYREFGRDKCYHLAAALSYYTIFSLAPMLIIVVSVGSLFLGNEAFQDRVLEQIGGLVGTEGAESVRTMMDNAYHPKRSLFMSAVGVGTLIVGATSVFIQIQDALNIIWSVRPKPRRGWIKMLRDRLLSFGMILGVGFLLLVSLALNAALAALSAFMTSIYAQLAHVFRVLEIGLSFFLNTVLFGAIFKFLPDVKIHWHDVKIGALMTSALFAVGKILIGMYLGNGQVASAYGAAGAVIIIILWVNYSSLILFFGAELTKVYAMQYGSHIVPADYAVRIVRVEEEVEKT